MQNCRVATAYTKVHVGNPEENFNEILVAAHRFNPKPEILIFPELCMTGYTCGDLFNQSVLLENALVQTQRLAQYVGYNQIIVVGLPFAVGSTIYNCAAVLNNTKIVGIVPKTYLANYKEFYEARWFCPAPQVKGWTVTIPAITKPRFQSDGHIKYKAYEVPFGTDLLFVGKDRKEIRVGIEICEDLWATIPPSSFQAVADATILLNLSASNETVGKSEYRRALVQNQSARCMASYVYSSAGPSESTSDLVFGGHCIIAENGWVATETERFKMQDQLIAEIDLEKMINERRRTPTFSDSRRVLGHQIFREVEVIVEYDERVQNDQ
jgi:NAD+ synthase (glutamine-hydrolysing)